MNIAGKTILITGASRGIGRALVEEALRRGAKRVYAGTRGPLPHGDARVAAVRLDVTSAEDIRRAVASIDSLDVLVNNAGIAPYDDLSNPEVLERTFAVNLFGVLNVTRAFLPLLNRSRGAVVNHLSMVALAALPMIPAYSISKAAALNLTQSLRALLAVDGVTVHGVVGGPHRYGHEPRLRYPQGDDRVRGARDFRWARAGRGGHLPRSGIPVGRRRVAERRSQGARAAVCCLRCPGNAA